jgi:hypothetical protein
MDHRLLPLDADPIHFTYFQHPDAVAVAHCQPG